MQNTTGEKETNDEQEITKEENEEITEDPIVEEVAALKSVYSKVSEHPKSLNAISSKTNAISKDSSILSRKSKLSRLCGVKVVPENPF